MLDFDRLFARPPAVTARAPGRVNLIGEHTDYNDGFVLPAATPQQTCAAVAPRADRTVRAASANMDAAQLVEYRLGRERPGRGWLD